MSVTRLPGKVLLATALTACLVSSASHASDWDEEPADSSTVTYAEGHWGMGAGAISGAVVGGPPGFVVGAIVGKLYGRERGMQRSIDERDVQLAALRAQLSSRDKTIASLEQQDSRQATMLASLADVPLHDRPDFEQLMLQGFSYAVYFRTASDRIEDHLLEPCRALARILVSLPDVEVKLAGHADARGEASYNLSLSNKRLQAVKSLLLQEGLAEENIRISAKGEQALLNLGNDQGSHSFDRRVVITVGQKGGQS